jgi:hypothetical protein
MFKKSVRPTATLTDQLLYESKVMAQHAFTSGLKVPVIVIQQIDTFEQSTSADRRAQLEALINAHTQLAGIVAPATPETLVMLNPDSKTAGFWQFLGPVAFIRHMTVVSLVFLLLFVALTVFEKRLTSFGAFGALYYLTAAGLGASFTALRKANRFVVEGKFDPTFTFSYWIRFTLGLMAGPILSILIPFSGNVSLVLVALIGGFSSDVLFNILTRFGNAVENAVEAPASPSAANEHV